MLPFSKAAELMQCVGKAELCNALASSAKQKELAALKRILGQDEDQLDAETSSSDAERSRPFPDIFEAAPAQLPSVRTIGRLCVGFPEGDLLAAGCIAICRDPAHLLAKHESSPLGAGVMPD